MGKDFHIVDEIEELLNKKDFASLQKELPSFLKGYKKIAKRFDKIISQSDMQQMKVLKLTEALEKTNQKVKVLLDNAGQGFLQFDKEMMVDNEYSKTAKEIFDMEIANKDITHLLYPNDSHKADFFKETLQGILDTDELRQEVLLSLLQNEFVINGRWIEVEYKLVSNDSYMLILTDITEKKELEKQSQREKQILKMVVEFIRFPEQFLEIEERFKILSQNIDTYKTIQNLSNLRREIHTFKGLFAQKEMINVVEKLHNLETFIDKGIKENRVFEEIMDLSQDTLINWMDEDVKILKDILGEDYFSDSNSILVDKSRIDNIIKKVKKYVDKELLQEIESLKYANLKTYLKTYKNLISQLSLKFDKPVEFIMNIEDEIYLSEKYNPFLNSLVHIFRNSLDHGIEDIETRFLNNKPEVGIINLNVTKENNNLILEISDDGAGISEEIDEESIFEDGFSSKDTITDISGRGVGMYAVKKEIEKLNGKIELFNEPKKGLKFIITIPLGE